MELLFRDLFVLRDRFKELGMVIKNGEVYLPDFEERDVYFATTSFQTLRPKQLSRPVYALLTKGTTKH